MARETAFYPAAQQQRAAELAVRRPSARAIEPDPASHCSSVVPQLPPRTRKLSPQIVKRLFNFPARLAANGHKREPRNPTIIAIQIHRMFEARDPVQIRHEK